MSLFQKINEKTNNTINEFNIITDNIDALAWQINEEFDIVTEAITNWLSKVGNTVGRGTLDPAKQKSVAEILGAVMALGNPDTAAAFDEKGDLGTVLSLASSQNPQESNAALKRLREIGRHPSAQQYTQEALSAISSPETFSDYVGKAKTAIDKVMRMKLNREKGQTEQGQAPTQQAPVQQAAVQQAAA